MSEPSSAAADTAGPKKRPLRRFFKWLAIVVVVLLITAEIVLRIAFGLGNPPLSMFDQDMEYRYQPNKTYHRFGRLIHYNAYSQRADDFPEHKSSPDELRVMMIGDSVINGGAWTDQSELASSILQRELTDALHRKVIVGNASASSWGPPNELAYMKKFGLFDADVVVVVFNDLDAYDAMTFEPVVGVSVDYPDHAPLLALQEVYRRYLPMITARFRAPTAPLNASAEDERKMLHTCMDAIRQIVQFSREHGAKVIVAQHRELPERLPPNVGPKLIVGHQQIAQTVRELGIEPIDMGPGFRAAMQAGKEPYRANDIVHPSVLGQRMIADALFPAIRDALQQATTQPTTAPQ